jgi:hypothetical protein
VERHVTTLQCSFQHIYRSCQTSNENAPIAKYCTNHIHISSLFVIPVFISSPPPPMCLFFFFLPGNKSPNLSTPTKMIKIHSHCLSHSHQLHTPQSDIAPRPNVHWMKHSGEPCHQPATKDKVGAAETRKSRTWVERSEC